MSKICAVLQADGLLDRQPHTDDARSRRLALTADGHRLHDLLSQAGADAERAWTDLVGAQTLQTVRAALAAFAHSPEPPAPTTQVPLRFTLPPPRPLPADPGILTDPMPRPGRHLREAIELCSRTGYDVVLLDRFDSYAWLRGHGAL